MPQLGCILRTRTRRRFLSSRAASKPEFWFEATKGGGKNAMFAAVARLEPCASLRRSTGRVCLCGPTQKVKAIFSRDARDTPWARRSAPYALVSLPLVFFVSRSKASEMARVYLRAAKLSCASCGSQRGLGSQALGLQQLSEPSPHEERDNHRLQPCEYHDQSPLAQAATRQQLRRGDWFAKTGSRTSGSALLEPQPPSGAAVVDSQVVALGRCTGGSRFGPIGQDC